MEKFRKTTEEDLVELMALFEEGIAFLKAQGSPQWQDGYGPKENQIKADIANGESCVGERWKNRSVCRVGFW